MEEEETSSTTVDKGKAKKSKEGTCVRCKAKWDKNIEEMMQCDNCMVWVCMQKVCTLPCRITGGGGLLFVCDFFPRKPFYYDPPFLDFRNFENNFKIFICDFQV